MSFLAQSDVKDFLNLTSYPTELALHVNAACDLIENAVGPVTPRTVTETIHSRSGVLVLTHTPVISVTSLASLYVGNLSWLPGDFTLDAATGVLYQPLGRSVDGPYVVTYQSGRQPVPDALVLAALFVVRETWGSQRGASPLPMSGEGQQAPPTWTEALTPRAAQLVAPYRRAAAIG